MQYSFIPYGDYLNQVTIPWYNECMVRVPIDNFINKG